jgi:serine/threonine protein kinase
MQCIGRGAYSNVFALDNVAYKIPYEWVIDTTHTVLREGLLLAKGHGPPFVGLCADDEKFMGLAMRRAARGLDSASATVKQFKPSKWAPAIRNWLLQLLRQLAMLHEAELIHADIKPQNILIMENGSAVLSDFGLARRSGSDFVVNAYTTTYRAPELEADPNKCADWQCDIWALGVSIIDCILFALEVDGSPLVSAKPWRDFYDYDTFCTNLEPLGSPDVVQVLWSMVQMGPRPKAEALGQLLQGEEPILGFNFSTKSYQGCVAPDFHIWVPMDLAPLNSVPNTSIVTAKTICENVCNIVQLPYTVVWPNAMHLFCILSRARFGLESAPYKSIIIQATIASVLCIFLVREAHKLRLQYAAKICSVDLLTFEGLLSKALLIAIHFHDWSDGLWGLSASTESAVATSGT